MSQADAVLGHGAIGGAGHTAVGGAFEGLVEDAGTGCDEADANKSFDQSKMEGGDARREAAEIIAGGGVDDDHQGHARFNEHSVVAEQGMAASPGWRYRRCGGGGHVKF